MTTSPDSQPAVSADTAGTDGSARQPTETTGKDFKRGPLAFPHASAGRPTRPRRTSSAAGRADKTNYDGDKWQLQDASITVPAPTRIDWDFDHKTSFSPDEVGAPAGESSVTGYFPWLDPSGQTAGQLCVAGANCMQSLGLANPAATSSYRFATQSANSNGTSASPFVAPTAAGRLPRGDRLPRYTGYTGTCAKTERNVRASSVGGTADAGRVRRQRRGGRPSVGRSLDRARRPFSGPSVTVPSGATGFTLDDHLPGRLQGDRRRARSPRRASLAGFSAAAGHGARRSSPLTPDTNQMQKTGSVTLNSVNLVV